MTSNHVENWYYIIGQTVMCDRAWHYYNITVINIINIINIIIINIIITLL